MAKAAKKAANSQRWVDRRLLEVDQGLVVEGRGPGGLLVQPEQGDDADQHEQAAEQGVDEELDRRVDPPLPAEGADQEVGRDQHRLPEHVEQEQVEAHEHAEHGRLEHQQQGQVGARPVGHAPGAGDGQRGEHGREQDQGQADAVDPDPVADPEGRHPVGGHAQLETGLAGLEAGRQRHRQGQGDQAGRQRDHPDRLLPGRRDEGDQQRPGQGGEQGQGQQHGGGSREEGVMAGTPGRRRSARRPRGRPGRSCGPGRTGAAGRCGRRRRPARPRR